MFLSRMAVAFGAGDGVHEAGHPLLQAGGGVVEGQVGHVADDAGELAEEACVLGVLDAGEVVAAVEDGVHGLLAEVADGGVEGEVVVSSHEFQFAVDIVGGRVFAEHLDAAVAEALFGVWDELLHVNLCHAAQAAAVGAGAVGRVEGEGVGFGLGVGETAVGVHEHAAEVAHGAVVVVEHHQHALALAEGGLHGLFQAGLVAVGAEAVDDQLDVVYLVAVHLHVVGQLAHLAVDADFEETLLGHLCEEFAVVAFAAFDQRGQDHDVVAAEFRADNVDDFLLAVFHHGFAGGQGVGLADACVE